MQSSPKELDLDEIKSEVEKINGIRNIHHIHVWSLTDRQIHFEGHIDLSEDLPVSKTDVLRNQVISLLHQRFNIEHVTLQMEFGCCDETEMIKQT